MNNSAQFQQKIGYTFCDIHLLDKALTHSSYVKETGQSRLCDNERLEFLGDAFLDAIIGEELYRRLPKAEEGKLTKARASIVCEKSLAAAGRKLSIGEHMLFSRGEEKSGGRDRDSILADGMEAVIGAIYLDGGYEQVRSFVVAVSYTHLPPERCPFSRGRRDPAPFGAAGQRDCDFPSLVLCLFDAE